LVALCFLAMARSSISSPSITILSLSRNIDKAWATSTSF